MQKMVEMEERLTARIGASSAHHSSGTHDNNHQLCRLRDVWIHLYPSYKYQDPDAAERNKQKSVWDVPQCFVLPSADLYFGWQRWLQGIASYASADGNGKIFHAPLKPIRLLKHGNLPVKIRRSYDNNWKAIMELLEEEVKEEVRNRHVDDMDSDFFRGTYDKALKGATEKYPVFATARSTAGVKGKP